LATWFEGYVSVYTYTQAVKYNAKSFSSCFTLMDLQGVKHAVEVLAYDFTLKFTGIYLVRETYLPAVC